MDTTNSPRPTGRAGITIALSLATGLASLGTSIVNIALPDLARAFSEPLPQVQAVTVAYLASLTVCVVVAGRLADRLGAKAMLVLGLVLFALATGLCAAAPSLSVLIAARTFQGAGAAFLMTLAMALMRQTTGETQIGRAMGLLGTVSAIGTALGPSLGGLLIPLSGWRAILWVQLPPAAVALILAVSFLPRDARLVDSRAPSLWSVMDRSLAGNLLVNVLVAAIMMTTLVVGPFYLSLGLGLTVPEVGAVMAIGPVISIVSGVPSGRLVDAWGSGRMLVIGLALLGVGALMLAIVPGTIGVAGYVLSIIVLTPGYQLFQAANNAAALADVAKDRRGTVSGLLGLSRNIGLIAGASAMGLVFALGVGTTDVTEASALAIASGMRLTFLIAGAGAVAAFVVAVFGPGRHKAGAGHRQP
ncbi:MFS transporter [Agrobacterium tumefaciens]|uniref:MFS transporter n=1 Tax=Agrobacterium tumefaciens TaxID=358 RepID=A0A2L2LLU9_AGRTU|nr:MFS transporter [Agrobacterium tumefaciens]AVH45304.1 MFS transporter [Agrobacterium tumefaciens]NSY99041.1 MFS transporter [Agrobacterium tumefaciens]